ncbi:hypothetical protein GCM10017653_17460 [Ancylobacter defluvii]|uniref:DUF5343 domain-containing protein n=2 Tax=Ancylobacter defluvii TaxID=1282440 RepID=A0A9W6JUU0_9HYPH|nr:hypothetical protein GCM10017653_17460 [Ancylobacter defluvii]
MADKSGYPQIPSTVWWGVRSILDRSPKMTINERTLGVELNVQEAAARQYVAELRKVGLLNDDGKATPLAEKWRHDDTYGEAVDEILRNAYPEGLIGVAPRGYADRQKVVSWFTREGLGSGTAGNKAATYLLISSASPSESPNRGSQMPQKPSPSRETAPKKATSRQPTRQDIPNGQKSGSSGSAMMPLNINVQIHISAEATTDQIETIFSAMRRYLYDGSVT